MNEPPEPYWHAGREIVWHRELRDGRTMEIAAVGVLIGWCWQVIDDQGHTVARGWSLLPINAMRTGWAACTPVRRQHHALV
jgi:hypothetical protein